MNAGLRGKNTLQKEDTYFVCCIAELTGLCMILPLSRGYPRKSAARLQLVGGRGRKIS